MQKLYVLDFEEVLRNFTPYHDSVKVINKIKSDFSDRIENLKKEMQDLVNPKLLLTPESQKNNNIRIKEIQVEAMNAESEYRSTIIEKQNEVMEKNVNDLNDIVTEWINSNSGFNPIDLVVNKNVVVYVKENYDITTHIMGHIKTKGLYTDYNELADLLKENSTEEIIVQ